MLKIHTAYCYGFWKCRSITERILLLAVTLGETDSARHVAIELVVGAKAGTPYNPAFRRSGHICRKELGVCSK